MSSIKMKENIQAMNFSETYNKFQNSVSFDLLENEISLQKEGFNFFDIVLESQ